MAEKVSKTEKRETLSKAILRLQKPLQAVINNLSRLKGIVDKATDDNSEKEALHRIKCVIGYRRQSLKVGATLYNVFNDLQHVLDSME